MQTRTLLLLLSAFFLSCSADHIDWKQCGNTVECYIRESCVDQTKPKDNLISFKVNVPMIDGICDVIIQIRPYLHSKFHIYMQVNASISTEAISDPKAILKQGEDQFSCTKKGASVNINLFTMRNEQHTFENNILFCSFTMESNDADIIMTKFITNTEKPSLELSFASPESITFQSTGLTFWMATPKCDAESIQSIEISEERYLQQKIQLFEFPPISCVPPKTLIISRDKPVFLDVGEQLVCEAETWKYNTNSMKVLIPKSEKFNVVCAEKFCSRCAPLGNIVITDGSEPTNGTSDEGCLTATCADNKPWIIEDGRVVNGEMKCEKDQGLVKTSSWYLKTANESIKVTKASCVNTRICHRSAKFLEKCPDHPTMQCVVKTMSADGSEFSCSDDYKLKWAVGGASGIETASIKCDFASGYFVDANKNQLKDGYTVVCTKPAPPQPPKPDEGNAGAQTKTGSSAGPIAGGVLGGLILIGLAAALTVVIVKRRRKAAYQAWLDQPLHQEDEADQIFMPILRTPEQDMEFKKHTVEVEQRLPWDKRPQKLHELVPNPVCFGKFDNGSFDQLILKEYIQYNHENRKRIFLNLSQMRGYSDENDNKGDCGNFTQFWRFFQMCVLRNMDSVDVWEMIFRLVRIFHGRLRDRNITGTTPKVTEHTVTFDNRIKMVMIRFAKPILQCLGWARKPTDSDTDVWMRFLVVRVLAWCNEKSVHAELDRQADLPLEELESPMRAIVIGFASARLDRGREFFDQYMPIATQNPQDVTRDEYGTLRQHIMFGLAMPDRTRRGMRQMKEVLDTCFNFETVYTAEDMYWAYRGATEQYSSSFEAVEHYINKLPKSLSFYRDDQLRNEQYKQYTEGDKALLRIEWKRATMKTLNVLVESTSFSKQYESMEEVVNITLKYCDTPGLAQEFNMELMKARVETLAYRFWDKKKAIEEDFSSALEWAEPKREKKKEFPGMTR